MGRKPGSLNRKTVEKRAQQLALGSSPGGGEEASPEELSPSPIAAGEFIEYPAPGGGPRWRVERGMEFLETFEAAADEASEIHECLALDERAWRLARLRFGIAPLLGETNEEYMRPHSDAQVAALLAIPEKELPGLLGAAVDYWKRWRTSRRTSATVAARAPERALPGAAEGGVKMAELPHAHVDSLLALHGFEGVDDADRQFVAQRVLDLQTKLEDEEGSSLARNAISLELQLRNFDRMLFDVQKAMKTGDAKQKATYRKEFTDLTNARKGVSGEYVSVMEALDATQAQNPSARKKAVFRDCISSLMEAVRAYASRGDRTLVDGMHTAAEIELLITETTFRPPQYRPDIVAVVNDAMKEENFLSPDYVPPTMPREEYRRFRQAWMAALRATQEGGPLSLDDDEPEVEAVASVSEEISGAAGGAAPSPLEADADMAPVAPQLRAKTLQPWEQFV